MKRVILVLFLAVTLTLSSATPAVSHGTSDGEVNLVDPVEQNDMPVNQDSASSAYERIWMSFPKNEFGDAIYPDHYAGEYINKDNELVILLVDDSEDNQTMYRNITNNSKQIVFEKAKYSLPYLQSLERVALDLIEAGYPVTEHGVDRVNNEYFIGIISARLDEAVESLGDSIRDLPIRFDETSGNSAA